MKKFKNKKTGNTVCVTNPATIALMEKSAQYEEVVPKKGGKNAGKQDDQTET